MEHFGKIKFYSMLLDSLFKNKSKPSINYYTTDKIGSTKIMELGAYVDDAWNITNTQLTQLLFRKMIKYFSVVNTKLV